MNEYFSRGMAYILTEREREKKKRELKQSNKSGAIHSIMGATAVAAAEKERKVLCRFETRKFGSRKPSGAK